MDDLFPVQIFNFDNDQDKNPDYQNDDGLDEKTITIDSSKFFKSIINNTQTVKSDRADKPKDSRENPSKK